MESNHTFKTKELTADDSNFKPFTGDLPSRFQEHADRAIKCYERALPSTLAQLKGALVCINSAVLRTAYALDTKENPLSATIARAQADFEVANDPVFKLKHAG